MAMTTFRSKASDLRKIVEQTLLVHEKNDALFNTPNADFSTTDAVESGDNFDSKNSSILNFCDSFDFCESCAKKIWKRTVLKNCTSGDSCKLCLNYLSTFDGALRKKYNRKKTGSKTSQPSKLNSELTKELSAKFNCNKSYEQMKKIIESQNDVISKLQNLIKKSALKEISEIGIEKMANKLEKEKTKLRKMIQRAMIIQKKHKHENWKPIPVNIVDDF